MVMSMIQELFILRSDSLILMVQTDGFLMEAIDSEGCLYVAWQNIHTNLIKPEKNLFNH